MTRWLKRVPGSVVELTCHPGYHDPDLVGRDCTEDDGQLERRTRELALLRDPGFRAALQQAGFRLIAPAEVGRPGARAAARAA